MNNKINIFLKLAKAGHWDKALKTINDISFSEVQRNSIALFALADCEYELGRYNKAVELYDLHTKLYPDHKAKNFVLYNIGLIKLEQNSFEEALSFFNKVNSDHRDLSFRKAECFYHAKQYQDCITTLADAVSSGSSRSEAYWRLGLAYDKLDAHADSLVAFQTCLREGGCWPELYDFIVSKLIWLKRTRDAESFYREHQTKLPSDFKVLYRIAISYNANRNFRDAIRVLLEYLSDNPLDAEALTHLGINHYLVTPPNLKTARICLERSLVIEPDSVDTLRAIEQLNIYERQL